MKKKLLGVVLILLFSLPILYVKTASASAIYPPKVAWAVIIVGTDCWFDPITGGRSGQTDEPLRTAYYLFHVLREHFGVPRNHIRLLHIWLSDDGFVVPYGTIDAEATKAGIKYTLNTWLQSTSNDNVLLFIFAHGSGYLAEANAISSSATKEIGGDEGDEILESTYGQDVNGDGDKNDWFGVDESLVLACHDLSKPIEYYSDDELKSDLQNVQCNQMIVIINSCFSGGFIDDLSASNRIIITSSSETKITHGNIGDPAAGFGLFMGPFIDAFNGDTLHRYHASWNYYNINRIVDQYEITVPDQDCDGIDWRNAYAYARDRFLYDSPWFDGDGNGLPTYKDGRDYIEYFLYVSHTWGGYTTPETGGYEYPAGTTVNVYATPCIAGYYFAYWLSDDIPWWMMELFDISKSVKAMWNPYTYTMDKDHMIRGYFYLTGGVNGGDGCPKLYTWNGFKYIDYGVINIHNPSGEDVIKEVPIAKNDLAVEGFKAKIRLQEGWLGLNYSESVIDQVKLYAIDSYGNRLLCPLTKAIYENNYNVLLLLIDSDDFKLNIYLLETIDLEFIVPYQKVQDYTFAIEGCNIMKM